MKKYIFLIAIAAVSCKVQKHDSGKLANGQSLKKDTSLFIEQNIIAKKNKYLNKQLSVLLGDLPLPVMSYVPMVDMKNKNFIPGIELSFFDQATTTTQVVNNKRMILDVIFSVPVAKKDIDDLINNNKGNWSAGDKSYFQQLQIKDIAYVR